MADPNSEVPDGAAVLPEIPAELNIHPLLLVALHTVVFLAGSDDELVNPTAADEAVERVGDYLRRLTGTDLERVRADLALLTDFARQQEWEKEDVELFQNFLSDFGVGEEGE